MKRLAVSALVVSAVAAGLAGCMTQPIYNVHAAPLPLTSQKAADTKAVEAAIVRAGSALGWTMIPASPGLVNGELRLRRHVANIEVKYDATTYSIQYKDSSNLDASGGQIHKNYNGWITNLDREIKREISRL